MTTLSLSKELFAAQSSSVPRAIAVVAADGMGPEVYQKWVAGGLHTIAERLKVLRLQDALELGLASAIILHLPACF